MSQDYFSTGQLPSNLASEQAEQSRSEHGGQQAAETDTIQSISRWM